MRSEKVGLRNTWSVPLCHPNAHLIIMFCRACLPVLGIFWRIIQFGLIRSRDDVSRDTEAVSGCRSERMIVPARLCLFGLLCGCCTLANGRAWGEDASATPGWERIWRAAKNAALANETWVPAAGALVFQMGHADENLQAWAAKHTPVFGSQRNADRASDKLKHASGALWLASGLATPSGDDGGGDEEGEWLLNKARGLGIQAGTGVLLRSTVGILKDTTGRTRPNGLGKTSFPSDHASNTSVYTTMASKNIEHLGWPDNAVSVTRFGLGTITAATAWARIEANQHYPSDVLAGIALGHFFGAFFTDAFLGIDDQEQVMVLFEPSRKGYVMIVRFGL